jgi:hypothetical protein
MVDAVAGKAQALGAHRATLVAAAGFTKGALERIRAQHPNLIDAVELRATKPDEWPRHHEARSFKFEIDGTTADIPLHHRRYLDAVSRKPLFDVLYGYATVDERVVVAGFLIDPNVPDDEHGLKDAFFFTRGGDIRPGDTISLTSRLKAIADGSELQMTQTMRVPTPKPE